MRGRETSTVKRIRTIESQREAKAKSVKRKRKELVKATKDRVRNVNRATENMGALCIVCGKRIKKGQPIRILPKDRNCQEVRIYHLRTCGPGSENWKSFKAQGKKTPKKPFQWQQLSFEWKIKN